MSYKVRFLYAIAVSGVFIWSIVAAFAPSWLGKTQRIETGAVVFCGLAAVVIWLRVLGILGKR